MKKRFIQMTVVLGVVALGACSLAPQEAAPVEHYRSNLEALQQYLHTQNKAVKPISLSDALARTLSYNLEGRLKRLDIAMKSGQLNQALWDLAPSMDVAGNYGKRNNKNQQLFVNASGALVTSDRNATPQELTTANIGLNWNILDFGLSYIMAKQQADQVLIARAERAKALADLSARATVAYWKAYSAEVLLQDVEQLRTAVAQALVRSKKVTKARLARTEEQLEYQQLLLRSGRRLTQFKVQLAQAQSELANLMSLPPSSSFTLEKPSAKYYQLPEIKAPIKELDAVALTNRPELHGLFYKLRIAEHQVTATTLNMLPSLGFNYGYNYNSNKYLVNNRWMASNFDLTWNLVKLLSGPGARRLAKTNVDLEKMRKLAMGMTVLTEVRLAVAQYDLWREDYLSAQQESAVANKLYLHAKRLKGADAGSEQTVIRRGVVALNAKLDEAMALAKAQEALLELYRSVGVAWVPDNLSGLNLAAMGHLISLNLARHYETGFDRLVESQYQDITAKLLMQKKA